MDSSLVTDAYSMRVIGNVEEGLTRSDNGKPSLALAKSIDISKDGKTYTIELRPNLKWSNGDKLTAHDFVYAWQRGANPKTASQYAYLLAYVQNGAEINAGKKPVSSLGVKALSDTKLVVTLKQPTPFFKSLLSMAVYLPEDQKVVEKYGKQYGISSSNMVYDGPFYFKKGASGQWNGSNNSYTLEKNPNYYDKAAVKSKSINLTVVKEETSSAQLFKQGKLDMAPINQTSVYNTYKNNKDFKNIPVSENEYLEFNQSGKGASSALAQKALANKNIRAALVLATDRKGILKAVEPSAKVAESFTPISTATIGGKDFSEYAKQKNYTYDPAKAKEYFKKGLSELGVSSIKLSFETDSDSAVGKQYADYMEKMYESNLPGLTINERLVPFEQRLKDAADQNFDIINTLWGADYPDPSTYLQMFVPDGGNNDGKFNNAAFNKALTKATTAPDVLNRKKAYADYKDAETALAEEYNVDPIDFRTAPYLVNPDLKGINYNATGTDMDFKEAYIK